MKVRHGILSVFLATAVTLFSGLLRSSLAQEPAASVAQPSDSATRGKAIFEQKCALCHSVTAEKKIGPGLQGFWKRGTFTSDGAKVSDEALVHLLQTGKGFMPAFNDTVLPPASRDDVIAYVKTL